MLYILGILCLIVMLSACLNYTNLSVARALTRAKEVGVRKVIGAGRNDLVKQFLGESFLLSLAGVLIALPLLFLALPLIISFQYIRNSNCIYKNTSVNFIIIIFKKLK